MAIRGYKVSSNGVFKEFIMPGFDKLAYANSEDKISVFRALAIMGTCHNVAISVENGARLMLGDPMEIKMIDFSSYYDIEPKRRDAIYAMHNSVRDLVYNVYRRFEFLSEVGRMSVVAQAEGRKEIRVYAKGAPEIMKTLCEPSSIPKNYDERLADYTILGYRVLALAWRDLTKEETKKKFQDLEREKMEKNLTFVGFLIFENMLKPDSRDVIASLNHAAVESKIVTGDNPITAVHVGREIAMLQHDNIVYVCDIIEHNSEFYLQFKKLQGRDSMLLAKFKGEDNEKESRAKNAHGHIETIDSENVFGGEMIRITHFIRKQKSHQGIKLQVAEAIVPSIPKGPNIQYAFTGKAFEFLYANSADHEKDLSDWKLRTILLKAKIYSRMQPNHKSSLIEMIQATGRMVAMVGDGANDCGALQTADVGISLSQTEASISAPLTSKLGSITAIIDVLAEGRCVLSTNVLIFKFMAFYGILQYTSSLLLTTNLDDMNNIQFLWQDLGLIAPAAAAMSWTGPYDQLEDDLPPGGLFTLRCMLSIFGSWILQGLGQYMIFDITSDAPIQEDKSEFDTTSSVQAAALFSFSILLYLGVIASFNVARPFRQPITSNLYLCAVILLHLILVVLQTIVEWVRIYIYDMPDTTYYTPLLVREVVGLSVLFALMIALYESFFVNVLVKYVERKFEERRKAKEAEKLYGMVEKDRMSKTSSTQSVELVHKM